MEIKKCQSMCILSSAVEYSQLEYLITCEIASEMWSKLSAIHEQKSAANKLSLMTKFHEFKMAPNDSIAQHVAKIENMARQLKDVGEELSDVMIMAKILGTLPQKFSPLVTAWDSVSEANQSRANLIERLLKEENRLANFEVATNALATMKIQERNGAVNNSTVSKTSASDSKRGKPAKKQFLCNYCRKKGHTEKRCYKKRDDDRTKREINNSTKDDNTANFGAFMVLNSDFATRVLQNDSKDVWLLDSGASKHMSFHREWFSELDENYRESVSLSDDSTCEVRGRGVIPIEMFVDGKWLDGKLEDALYIPSLRKNLFSTGVCTSKGYTLNFEANSVKIYRKNLIMAYGIQQNNNLFRLLFKVKNTFEANASSVGNLKLWHERLGHINCKSLSEMVNKNLINGVSLFDNAKFFCESCQSGKQHRLPFKTKEKCLRERKVGEFIHTDLCGPMSEVSIGGSRYFLLFKDDKSSFRHVFFLKYKSKTVQKFKEFEQLVFNQLGTRIKTARADNGNEFLNDEMLDYCRLRGIMLQTSAPYTHEQNGRSERERCEQSSNVRGQCYCLKTWQRAFGPNQ
ncbi:COPIA protein, partial [Pseudoatta argentina]